MALGRGNIEIDIRGNLDTSGIARQVSAAEKKIRPINLSMNEKGFTQPLGRISGDLAEFQKSLDASVARTLAFGAAVGVINSVSDAFKGLINSAVEVEKALTDVNVILNLNGQALQEFSSQLFDVAKNTGQSFQSVSEAAVELSRQGLGAEETLNRINDAMILTRLSGMDAAKSVETLTAAVNSFGSAALTTTDLVNKLATVDAAFAVSTEDLANALARAGSTAQSAKVDLNELLAAVTSVQQTTARGGAVIGNAFKSIFTRIQRSSVREALEDIGVATTDAAGNIRGALDILQDYAQVYKTLSDSQRAYTDELVAGVFQINNLRALVKDLGSDYSIYSRALDQSNNATDEAIRRNEKLQDTLFSLINTASVNVKELASTLGSLVATPAVENLLKAFNSIAGGLKEALDPEQGSALMQGIFSAIGKFISGPGLIIVGAAFIKLFKFITQQSIKAVGEIFKIGSAANKVADAEAKIGFLLKNNQNLYQAITNAAISHEQKEELVLQTIREQNRAYQQQQNLISRLAQSRAVQTATVSRRAEGYIPSFAEGRPAKGGNRAQARASGFIPNFANGVQGAISAEKEAISKGVGGASGSAQPKVLKNFPMGGGKRETVVANTDEVIVPRFGGGTGSAIFNQEMISKFGMPDGAISVASGYISNFAKSNLQSDKNFQNLLGDFPGINIDVQKDLSGFGLLSAKGARDNLSVTKKPGFTKEQKSDLINKIGGSKLSKDDVNYLLGTLGTRKKTRFSNIPAQTIESADPQKVRGKVGALNNLINPHIANAVADVATNIYTRVLGDEVTAKNLVSSVRSAANADQGIVSVGAQGDIFESAVRLGSFESAKSLAKDDRSAIWDFEESSAISNDLKSLFFPTSKITKADAKRSGDQTSAGQVVEKAYKNTFDDQLRNVYARSWAPIIDAATKVAPSKQETERRRTGTNFASGFIPSFANEFPNFVSGRKAEISEEKLKQIAARAKTENKEQKEYANRVDFARAYNLKENLVQNLLSYKGKAPGYAIDYIGKSGVEQLRKDFVDLTQHNKYKNMYDEVKSLKSKKETFRNADELSSRLGLKQGALGKNLPATLRATTAAGLDQARFAKDFKSLIQNEFVIAQTRVEGDAFEDFVSVLGGQKFQKGPTALDFAESESRGLIVDPKTREQIKMLPPTKHGDAQKGSGHPKPLFASKIAREVYKLGRLKKAGKTIDLNAGGEFYDVVAKGSDKKIKINEKFPDFYRRLGPKTQDLFVDVFGKRKQERAKDFKTKLKGETKEQKRKAHSKEMLRLFEPETLDKNVSLKYTIDRINPEELKVDKRTTRGKLLTKKLEKYLEIKKSAAEGFIPNFFGDQIKWSIDKAKNDYSLVGDNMRLNGFAEYLREVSEKDPKMVSPQAAATFRKRVDESITQGKKERKEVDKTSPIGTGARGAKHFAKQDSISLKDRKISTKGLYIKDLGKHIKQYNKHGLFAAGKIGDYDSFLANGFIPSFAFKNTAIRLDGGFGRKGRQIEETETGSYMNYTTNEIGDREIDFLQSNKKGDAYKMFKREGEGKFMRQGGAYTSPTIKQQRSFKQKSSTNFEDLVYAFPQLQYRMQPNMVTTGRMIHGPEGKRFRFDSLKNLRDIANRLDRQSFRDALGAFPGMPGMDVISIQDLATVNTKAGRADNIYKQFAKGLMPKSKDSPAVKPRALNLSWISPARGGGSAELRSIYKDIVESAKEGRPYTDLKAGFIVGPRIPRLLVEGQKLLNRQRSLGKNIPKMKITGDLTPAKLMDYVYRNKRDIEEGHPYVGKEDYKTGEELEVAKYLRVMGLDPLSSTSVEVENLPMFKNGFAQGHIPNFADALQAAITREEDALKSQGSSADVYVDQDNRLKGAKNPMGLLVANKRDEPSGGFQGVNRAMSMGVDPKKHGLASGYIPNYVAPLPSGSIQIPQTAFNDLKTHINKVGVEAMEAGPPLEKQAKSTDKVSKTSEKKAKANEQEARSSGDVLAKVFALQFALGAFGDQLNLTMGGLNSAIAGLTAVDQLAPGLGKKLGKFKSVFDIAVIGAGLAFDAYKNFFDAQGNAIKLIDAEVKAREEATNAMSQNIEKIDQFATSIAKFSQASEAGKPEVAAKFMQEIFNEAKDLAKLDISAFEDVIDSIGDTEKLNAAIDVFKKTAAAGKDLKVVENDFAKMVKSFKQSIDDEQFLGLDFLGNEIDISKAIDLSKFEGQFNSIAKTLTQNLSDEKIKRLSDSLQDFDTNAGDSGKAMLLLQSIFGEFDDSTKALFTSNERLTSGVLDQIKQQSAYSAAVIKSKEAFEISRKPIEVLNDKLGELANGLISAAQSTQIAIDTITKTGKIAAESNLSRLQAGGTVTQQNLLTGQAAANIQNSVAQAAKQQEIALKDFAGQVIKASKEGTTTISGGVKTLIEGIKGGNISNENALKSLLEIQKTGTPEQKDAATKTIEELRKISNNQIKDTATISANLRAQLEAIKTQVINFQRNNQLSDSQLNILKDFDNAFKQGNQEGVQVAKSTLERIGELNQAISTIESLGGDPDILAELKESNRKLSQLENLRAAFQSLTGEKFDARSLDQLLTQTLDFDIRGLDQDVRTLFISLQDAVRTAISAAEEGGVKTAADVKEAALIEFNDGQVDALSKAMGKAVSDSLASALGLGPELAAEINQAVDVDLIARGLEQLSLDNAENAVKNAEIQKELNRSLVEALQGADFGSSASSLEKAAISLNEAADKIKAKFSASGFIPNYAPIDGVQRALKTERAMGAKRPVVDRHPSIGTYVRDGATQPNFAAVKRDHPEGISKASQNSRAIQSTVKASGFIPNFARISPEKNEAWNFVDSIYNKSVKAGFFGTASVDPSTASTETANKRFDKFIFNKARDLPVTTAQYKKFLLNPGPEDIDFTSSELEKLQYFRKISANPKNHPNNFGPFIETQDIIDEAFRNSSTGSVEAVARKYWENHDPFQPFGELDTLGDPEEAIKKAKSNIQTRLSQKNRDFRVTFAGLGEKVPNQATDNFSVWWKNLGQNMFYNQPPFTGPPEYKNSDDIWKEILAPLAGEQVKNVGENLTHGEIASTGFFGLKLFDKLPSDREYGRREDISSKIDSGWKKDVIPLESFFHRDRYGGEGSVIAEGSDPDVLEYMKRALILDHSTYPDQKLRLPYYLKLIEQKSWHDQHSPESTGLGLYFSKRLKNYDENDWIYEKWKLRNLEEVHSKPPVTDIDKKALQTIAIARQEYNKYNDFIKAHNLFDLDSSSSIDWGHDPAYIKNDGTLVPPEGKDLKKTVGLYEMLSAHYNTIPDEIPVPQEPIKKPEDRFQKVVNQITGYTKTPHTGKFREYVKARLSDKVYEGAKMFYIYKDAEMDPVTKFDQYAQDIIKYYSDKINALEAKGTENLNPEEKTLLEKYKEKLVSLGGKIGPDGKPTGGSMSKQREELETIVANIEGAQKPAPFSEDTPISQGPSPLEFRDRTYKALLGESVAQMRESKGAKEFKEQIDKTNDPAFKQGYIDYLEKLIKSRQASIQRESRFADSASIVSRSSAAISQLEKLKAIYSNDQSRTAYHMTIGDNWGQKPVLIGGGFDMPVEGIPKFLWAPKNENYIEEFQKLKEKYGFDNPYDQELGGADIRKGILEPSAFMNSSTWQDYIKAAEIQINGSRGESVFLKKFKSAKSGFGDDSQQRLLSIYNFVNQDDAALLSEDFHNPRQAKFIPEYIEDMIIRKDLNVKDLLQGATVPGDNKTKYLSESIQKRGGNTDNVTRFLVERMASMGIPLNSIASVAGLNWESGIGDTDTILKDIGDYWRNKRFKNGDFGMLNWGGIVPAVDPQVIDVAKRQIIETRLRDYQEQKGVPKDKVLSSFFDVLTGSTHEINEAELLNYPDYLRNIVNTSDQGKDLANQKISQILNNVEGINLEDWKKKYLRFNFINQFNEDSYTNKLDIPGEINGFDMNKVHNRLDDAGNIKNIFDLPGLNDNQITAAKAIDEVIRAKYHAINPNVKKFLDKGNINPLNEMDLPDAFKSDGAFKALFSSNADYFKNDGNFEEAWKKKQDYAPYGYTFGNYAKTEPAGKIDLIDPLLKALKTPVPKDEPNNNARGFVPNFSAIAGEIAASKAAGYKKSVTPSQVKTMSIPGVGKTAYNTQESVFKMPGVSQPFIAPPSSSKAAKPYAKEVEKKYNFNPYKKTAADGFVPNFQKGVDFSPFTRTVNSFRNIVDGFERHVSSFDRAIGSLDFREFSNASKEIYQASQEFSKQSEQFKQSAELIKQGAEQLTTQAPPPPSLDFSALTSAASRFSSGATKISDELAKPLQLDSSSMVSAMDNLTNALQNIQGSIDVEIPDVNVTVGGGGAIAASVSNLIKQEVPALVAAEVSKIDLTQQVRDYLR